jgi:DNA-directed RNA polymerase subunit M/transcription elongation factor TFIIS
MIACHKCNKSVLKTKKVDYHSGFIFCEGCGYSVCVNGLFAYKLFSTTSQEKEDEIIQYLTNNFSEIMT